MDTQVPFVLISGNTNTLPWSFGDGVCCLPLQLLYAVQDHEEMHGTAGTSHGGSTGKGVFHSSVGSKPLRPECLKNDSLYLGQSDFLNSCSTFPSPHYSMYHFNFLQVIIWWISHAHQALIFPLLCESHIGCAFQEEKLKNVWVKAHETSLICLNIFPVPCYPRWLPVGKRCILFAEITNQR